MKKPFYDWPSLFKIGLVGQRGLRNISEFKTNSYIFYIQLNKTISVKKFIKRKIGRTACYNVHKYLFLKSKLAVATVLLFLKICKIFSFRYQSQIAYRKLRRVFIPYFFRDE
jgi:hypothetical protein